MSMFNLTAAHPTPAALAPRATTPTPAAGTASTSSSSTQDIGSTFLNLLVNELKNQDPTAPMDSTAMVGQMISLNQLNQLTSINQVLTKGASSTATSAVATGSSTPTGKLSSPAASAAVAQALQILNGSSMASNPALNPSALGSLSSLTSFLPQ